MKPREHKGPEPVKRPYSAPTLVSYGDAVALTHSGPNMGGKKDGLLKLKMRTR